MSDFQLILRDWVKTTGFLTHELVKRFFLFYPLLCVASDCYLQVQVAFQAWFETIEHTVTAPESQVPVHPPTPITSREISISSSESHMTRVPSREPERPALPVGPEAEQTVNIEEAVRNILAEELRSEASNAEVLSEQ